MRASRGPWNLSQHLQNLSNYLDMQTCIWEFRNDQRENYIEMIHQNSIICVLQFSRLDFFQVASQQKVPQKAEWTQDDWRIETLMFIIVSECCLVILRMAQESEGEQPTANPVPHLTLDNFYCESQVWICIMDMLVN